MKNRAVFLDRDGTINEDVGYPNRFEQINIFPYSFEAVRKINEVGLKAVITTNQSGIGRGYLTEKDLHEIHQEIKRKFSKCNAFFDGIYYCPHYPLSKNPHYKKNCFCSKPNPGMAHQAALDLNLELKDSYMVGDKVEDIIFGFNFEAVPILVLTGYGIKSQMKLKEMGIQPAFIAQTLLESVHWILKKEKLITVKMSKI